MGIRLIQKWEGEFLWLLVMLDSNLADYKFADPGHGETPMPPFTHPSQMVPTWPPFKFSGKENLARVGLDLYDFGARMYSPSNMRWLTMDPLCEKYYSISPYAYCAGDPVNLVDPDGRTLVIWYTSVDAKGNVTNEYYVYSGQDDDNAPDNLYVQAIIQAYKFSKENWEIAGFEGNNPLVELVERDERTTIIDDGFPTEVTQQNGGRPVIHWSMDEGAEYDTGVVVSPATILAHEADHANDIINDGYNHNVRQEKTDSQFDNMEERRVITGSEQKVARANGEIRGNQVTRRNHKGRTVRVSGPTSTRYKK